MNETTDGPAPAMVNRRNALRALAATGIGTALFQRALAAQAATAGHVTANMIAQAEWIAGLELSPEDRETTARAVAGTIQDFQAMRDVEVGYDVPPALYFRAAPQQASCTDDRGEVKLPQTLTKRPSSDDELAFLPVVELASLIRSRQVSAVELTELYLERLHKFDEQLKCVVTFTDDLALKQARRADEETGRGDYRGPLHGIPWGAKDLIAYPGYKTTWGALQFKEQQLDAKATVAQRLDQAGAVLVAKLSMGALAWGDNGSAA